MWLPVHKIDLSTRYATDGSVETVSNTSVEIPRVETLKVRVEWYEALKCKNKFLTFL